MGQSSLSGYQALSYHSLSFITLIITNRNLSIAHKEPRRQGQDRSK